MRGRRSCLGRAALGDTGRAARPRREQTRVRLASAGLALLATALGGARIPCAMGTSGWPMIPMPAHADTLPESGDSLDVTPAEPPDDAADGADVVTERPGAVDDGDVEVAIGAEGTSDRTAHGRRRVRFRDGGLRGDLRSGDADPLAGGALGATLLGGTVEAGRVAPRWGRALVLGTPSDPWRATREADAVPTPRTRALDGARWRRAGRMRVELEAGSVTRERLGAFRVGAGAWDAGMLIRERGDPIVSLAWAERAAAAELGIDRAGRWRAEGARTGRSGTVDWSLRGRAGAERYAPPGSPAGRVPAQSSALELSGGGPVGWRALGALWRFRSGVAGGRGALEVHREMAHHDAIALGLEEQHGTRRDGSAPSDAMRQAGWAEWRAGRGPVRLGLREEVWGRRALARDAVRTVSTVRLEYDTGGGATIVCTRSAYRVRSGESLYLPEAGGDRLWLRAVTGAGTLTRVETSLPVAGGRLRASLSRIENPGRSPRPHWSFDWTRRSRTTRDPARAGP